LDPGLFFQKGGTCSFQKDSEDIGDGLLHSFNGLVNVFCPLSSETVFVTKGFEFGHEVILHEQAQAIVLHIKRKRT
jgi:hypothetical protein